MMHRIKKHLRTFGPYWLILAISVFYVLLNWNPYFTLYDWADVDDTMQYNLSQSFYAGEWLGSYNRATLIKGVVFPVWTAALHNLHIPLWFGNTIITIFAGIAIIYALRRIVKNKWVLTAIYALVILNPLVTDRVYRDYIIPAITLLICAWAIGMFITIVKARENRKVTVRDSLIFTLIGSIALPVWYYTREDGYWILPFVIGLFIIALVAYGINIKWKVSKHLRFIIGTFALLLIPFLLVSATGTVIAKQNEKSYGRYVVNDYFSSDFKDAYAALTRVDNEGKDYLTVPVSTEMRTALYKSVPAFKELQPCLDADNNKGMCEGFKQNGVDVKEIQDYQGGWFPFALRLAVEDKGYYATPSKAANYYQNLTQQVNKACESGALSCHEVHNVSLLPTPTPEIMSALFTSDTSSIWSMIYYLQKLERDDNIFNTYKVPTIPESQYLNDMAAYYGIRYLEPASYSTFGNARLSSSDTVLKIYQIINPVLMYGSILATILATYLHLSKRMRINWKLLVISWLLIFTIGLRLAMLGYVYTVHFPTTTNIYFAAVYSLLFLFEGLGIALAVIIIRNLRQKQRVKR